MSSLLAPIVINRAEELLMFKLGSLEVSPAENRQLRKS